MYGTAAVRYRPNLVFAGGTKDFAGSEFGSECPEVSDLQHGDKLIPSAGQDNYTVLYNYC